MTDEEPRSWRPDPTAEAAFAARAGYPKGVAAGITTSWWWYGAVSLQFWFRSAVWVFGERTRAATVWGICSTIALVVLTPLWVLGRKRGNGWLVRGKTQ